MTESSGEKTHPATPHRRQQARREGQAPRSHDLASVSLLFMVIGAFYFLGHDLAEQLAELTRLQLGGSSSLSLNLSTATAQLRELTWLGLRILLPVLGLALAGVLFTLWSQGGFLFHPKKAAPNWSHVDPRQGLQRLLSPGHGMKMVMNVLKLLVGVSIAAFSIVHRKDEILHCCHLETPELSRFLVATLLGTALHVTGGLAVLAVLDYGYQWWQHERDLRMTDQELRDELRTLQGDPQVQSRRRQLQQQRHST
jgi:flagellar biosynthesis protein FlhB